jgi:DNA-binding NarL/FixJ family response regulator
MRSVIIGFGLLILCLLIFFKIAEVNFMKGDVRLELIVAVAALVFFFVGLYFNQRSNNQPPVSGKQESQEPTTRPDIDYAEIKKLGLSNREQEVLEKMAAGLSNQEIAQALFLSESTIKTHVSNILFKLDAKRRTEAVKIARDKKLVV